MKLSTKGRYGLRAAVALAMYAKDEPVSISTIAAREELSESYLEQLFAKLKKAGLVHSIRGTNGGYQLSRPAEDISVGDVLRALEGNMVIVDCPDSESQCAKYGSCVTKYVWKRINNSINDTMDAITLEELVLNSDGMTEQKGQKAYCSK
ncbi:RrF2 family transcriptional regulator [Frisingicoccus sp.]|uniref:RrF2 family transcriptional regulator n=1 Tax=Frisingicoccus sp. TaxID=1918627 RepID=UPI0025C58333|nr:Rrf2 family transcriptional regulator [Frisingicoccus sp.]MDD6232688.1 Rrf2 family transcriptional regulator [Frisingicoccus sp.]MDY4923294.1 Rrf2 family transcriptional regulator [Frisingicoccus sp.]MDY5956138.1 Rrf2 family transcriptional regulator [Frisingicoccus sp.]